LGIQRAISRHTRLQWQLGSIAIDDGVGRNYSADFRTFNRSLVRRPIEGAISAERWSVIA
jgi:hypothetical protein